MNHLQTVIQHLINGQDQEARDTIHQYFVQTVQKMVTPAQVTESQEADPKVGQKYKVTCEFKASSVSSYDGPRRPGLWIANGAEIEIVDVYKDGGSLEIEFSYDGNLFRLRDAREILDLDCLELVTEDKLNSEREGDNLPEDPATENGGFKKGETVKADGREGVIKKFGGDCVYVDHGDGPEEYDISEIEKV